MKTCRRCEVTKPDDDFAIRNSAKGTRQSWCRPCFTEYDRFRYHQGDKERKDKNKKLIRERQYAMVNKIKLESGCIDCGWAEHAIALDFDHIYDNKDKDVAMMIGRVSDARLLDEIAKCVVRCARCHRIVTHARRSVG